MSLVAILGSWQVNLVGAVLPSVPANPNVVNLSPTFTNRVNKELWLLLTAVIKTSCTGGTRLLEIHNTLNIISFVNYC